MSRPKGSRNTLVRITYDDVGRLVGVRGDTARRYAQRGLFDSRDLDSLLAWVNTRRAAQGIPLIGLPDGDAPQAHSDVTAADTPIQTSLPIEDMKPAALAGALLVYDPATGTYRDDDHGG
jgi:hypothetical protein